MRRAWILGVAMGLLALPAPAADLFVATTGRDETSPGVPNDCTISSDPCLTIQHSVDVPSASDRVVHVAPGTYPECVDAQAGGLTIVSEDIEKATNPTNTTTIIDGTGICDGVAGAPAGSGVLLGDGAKLDGFTVRGAANSGVRGSGSVVITRNEIAGNSAVRGGGVYVSSTVGASLSSSVDISANTIHDNTAETGEGGGIWLSVDTAASGTAKAVVTRNTIEGNASAAPGGAGSGGGIWAATYGYGSSTIEITDNGVRRNTSSGTGGGISSSVQLSGPAGGAATHELTIEGNSVSANVAASSGGGLDLMLLPFDAPSGSSLTLRATDNEITGNSAGGQLGGGGLSATLNPVRTPPSGLDFRIEGNTFRNNRSSTVGGGASLFVSADAEPIVGDPSVPSAGTLRFAHNLVTANDAHDAGSPIPAARGGGVYARVEAHGDATARVDVDLVTLAGNTTDSGGGGVDIEYLTAFDSGGISEGSSIVDVSNSIITGNGGFGVDARALSIPGNTAKKTIDVVYDDLFVNVAGPCGTEILGCTAASGDLLVDPDLSALFEPSVCSPTVDAGDPAADPSLVSLEPEPNGLNGPSGGRLNQGHLGGTPAAVRTFPDITGDGTVDGIDILRIASSFASTAAQVTRYNPLADRNQDGFVDGEDLAFVAAAFGDSCP